MKPRSEPPPVEALPDVAWGRVERELWTRLDHETSPPPRRSRRWIWLTVPVVVAAAALLVIVTRNSSRTPTSEDAPARVVAGDAPSSASFGDAHITLDARSAVEMQSDGHTVILENGAAWFAVGSRGNRPAFEVRAGDATVRVIGTRFRVAREGEDVAVVVDHGVVGVDFRGNHVELTAGKSWSSTTPDAIVTAAPPERTRAAPDPVASPATQPDPGAPSAPTISKTPPSCDADCARYRALEKLEAKQTEVAIKGYLELAQGSSKWAAVALYAAGRLAADRRDPRAVALLSIYLHRFPTGDNADDVSVLLNRLKGTSP